MNNNYVNRMSGPVEIKNMTDSNLKIKLIDPDGSGGSSTNEEVSIEKNGNSLKFNNTDTMKVNTIDTNVDIMSILSNDIEKARFDKDGVLYLNGIQQTCSRTKKENIKDIDISLLDSVIDSIDIKSFDYKESNNNGISLIIEDCIENNIPYKEYLFKDNDSSLDVNSLLGLTIAVLKEEKRKRIDLEERLDKLERMISK